MIFNGNKFLFLGDCTSGLINGILEYVIVKYINVSVEWTLIVTIAYSF
tara:strand:+ start:11635 stop:11778 length:144 start_codon:yes stop_codon:yes gene_type:complete